MNFNTSIKRSSFRSVDWLVTLLLLLLATHFIIRKVYLNQFLADDLFDFQRALLTSCSFDLASPQSAFNRCFLQAYSWLYEIPIIYFLSVLSLVFCKFLTLIKIFENLDRSQEARILIIFSAAFALLLVTIGGGSRFLIGSAMILTKADLTYRTWAQFLILVGLLTFVQRRYFVATIAFCPAILLQPLNSLNSIAIIGIAYLLIEQNKGIKRLPLYLVPLGAVVVFQYISAYGWTQNTQTFGENALSASSNVPTLEWFLYVYSQDPDDLSIWFNLTSNLGHGFLGIGFALLVAFGMYFGVRVENCTSFGTLLKRPAFAILLAGIAYLAACLIFELARAPAFVLEQLIVLQPRRVLYIPILMSFYYIARATTQFVLQSHNQTGRDYFELFFFYSIFSALLTITSWEWRGFSQSLTVVLGASQVIALSLIFFGRKLGYGAIIEKLVTTTFLPVLALLVLLKTLPYTTYQSMSELSTFFFTTQERSYADYMTVAAELSGEAEQYEAFLALTSFINEQSSLQGTFLTVGLTQGEQQNLRALTKRSFEGIDPFTGARGGAHFSKVRFAQVRNFLEATIGQSAETFSTLSRKDQISTMNSYGRKEFTRGESPLTKINGRPTDYVLFSTPCSELGHSDRLLFTNSRYCIYQNLLR